MNEILACLPWGGYGVAFCRLPGTCIMSSFLLGRLVLLWVWSPFAYACTESFQILTRPPVALTGKLLIKRPDCPSLSACISDCANFDLCKSFHYENTECRLYSSSTTGNDGELTEGVIGEKICLDGCDNLWVGEIFLNSELPIENALVFPASSRLECLQLCISNPDIECRGANYYAERNECSLIEVDRFAVSDEIQLDSRKQGVDYIESNCFRSIRGLCKFTEMIGTPIIDPDVVHSNVKDVKTCNNLCLNSTQFQCKSYGYNKSDGVCQLSHNYKQTNELRQVQSSSTATTDVASYHLSSCYNISVYCGANSMTAKIKSSRLFKGKVYDKSRPNSCVNDISNDTDFELEMGFNDLTCEVNQESSGKYISNIIIQHHDQIVTEQDVGLSIKCSYSLANRSVQHGVNLDVRGEPTMMGTHESSFVLSPTVTMHITDRYGDDIHTAQVGDPLSLRFRIMDQNSPYEIFVRELIAFDGVDSSEILLIDSLGCPTDPTIMGAINTVSKESEIQVLEAPFDAFKFPTSDIVQFKALVTPCLPSCEPVSCRVEDYFGTTKQVTSFGRRKRREIRPRIDEEVVMQSIKIQDKFVFDKRKIQFESGSYNYTDRSTCGFSTSLAIVFSLLATAQFLFCLMCNVIRKK